MVLAIESPIVGKLCRGIMRHCRHAMTRGSMLSARPVPRPDGGLVAESVVQHNIMNPGVLHARWIQPATTMSCGR